MIAILIFIAQALTPTPTISISNDSVPVLRLDKTGALVVRVINKEPYKFCSTMHCKQLRQEPSGEIIWECGCK